MLQRGVSIILKIISKWHPYFILHATFPKSGCHFLQHGTCLIETFYYLLFEFHFTFDVRQCNVAPVLSRHQSGFTRANKTLKICRFNGQYWWIPKYFQLAEASLQDSLFFHIHLLLQDLQILRFLQFFQVFRPYEVFLSKF